MMCVLRGAQGALVANYPWDGTPDKTTAYTAAPDDATFLAMASTYAQAHKKMALPDNKARRAALCTLRRPGSARFGL